jgi:hypothetical protein
LEEAPSQRHHYPQETRGLPLGGSPAGSRALTRLLSNVRRSRSRRCGPISALLSRNTSHGTQAGESTQHRRPPRAGFSGTGGPRPPTIARARRPFYCEQLTPPTAVNWKALADSCSLMPATRAQPHAHDRSPAAQFLEHVAVNCIDCDFP